jgi:hypothetical protein
MTKKLIKSVLRGVNDCLNGKTCPAVYELADGRLAVQGEFASPDLLAEAGVPPHETIVIIPRSLIPEV